MQNLNVPNESSTNGSNQTPECDPTKISTQKTLNASDVVAMLEQAASQIKEKKRSGPQTQAAKDRVKMNAIKHGFTGQTLIMGEDELEQYTAFRTDMLKDLAPVGAHETFLANSITDEAWRLTQIRGHCQNLTALGTFEGDGRDIVRGGGDPEGGVHDANYAKIHAALGRSITVRDKAKELALMSLYSQRGQRAYERYKNELEEMQEKRQARSAAELEEARLLYQLAEAQGLAYEPQKDGFVFSIGELKTSMDLFHRHYMAKKGDFGYRKEHDLIEFPLVKKQAA